MTRTLPGPVTAVRPLPRRYRLHRAGIHQVWQYDDVFHFGDGRLLLRGKNGAGKSKALEVLLPFLLDGDTRRLDAAGGGKTTLKWLMLDGWTGGTNRLGFLWVEFVRADDGGEGEDGPPRRLTVGAAVKASASTGEARPVFFVTGLAVGDDLPLHDPDRRPSLDRLRELVGSDNCADRAADHRARVARELFGLTDLPRYRNLVHLLYGLRRPTIGDRIESGELVKVLTEALPPLDDEVVDKVARNLDDLDTVRAELARLERTDGALTAFLRSYRGYLRGVLRRRVGQVGEALSELIRRRRAAGDAERRLAERRGREEHGAAAVEALAAERAAAETDLRALRDSAAYRALDDLRERRATVAAVEGTAKTAWQAAAAARGGEQAAAERLAAEVDEIGRDLGEVRAALRDARRLARGGGVEEALLGGPPATVAVPLAAAERTVLTEVGEGDVEVARPAARALDPATSASLPAWREQLGEADRVVRAGARAAETLRARLAEVAAREADARALGQEAERLDAQAERARERERERAADLVQRSRDYAARVRVWAQRLTVPDPPADDGAVPKAPGARARHPAVDTAAIDTATIDTAALRAAVDLPDDELPVEARALDRDAPGRVAAATHDAVDPVVAALDGARDEALAGERTIAADLAAAREERRRWEEQADPEPPRSRCATAARAPGTGAPLYLLVDFAGPLADTERAGLEAALEASGLLDGWVRADGTVLAADTRDVLLHASQPVAAPAPSLADVLHPTAAPAGSGVSGATTAALLRTIGLGESTAASWVGVDGRWRLGVATGAYGKDVAEYVGAGVRAATRARRVAELSARIDGLSGELVRARTSRQALESRRDTLRRAVRDLPTGRALAGAWAAYDQAGAEVARLVHELADARRAAERARAQAVALRRAAEAQATADGLPADAETLATLHAELGRLRTVLDALRRDAGRLLGRLVAHAGTRETWRQTRAGRTGAEQVYAAAYRDLAGRRRELRLLAESVGAAEQQILARESAAQGRLEAASRGLPPAQQAYTAARDDRVRSEEDRRRSLDDLAEQEQVVVAGGGLRHPLGLPGLPLAAALGDLDEALSTYDAAQDGDVRARVTALRALADDLAGRLGAEGTDVGDSSILRRGEELRDGLAGGYDASVEESDGIKRFALHDDAGTHDVAVVGQRIRAAVEEARRQLSTREQEVFERYLLGELGDHLSRQVLAARSLVAAMNDTLDQVRSSHGIGTRLVWELPDGTDTDVRAAVALVRQPSALRTREQSAQLREALRRRIEEARRADPAAGYAQHLRTALDYRSWFAFTVRVTDTANPDRERVLSHRTALSQGEQRVVSYLVLFATAAAHFSSIGGAAPAAPRLILLDDAFAKVDEPTHDRLLGLLVDLDLDFVITSERLWGCFPTVPSLHVYECLRDPHVRGVATVHFTWDGHSKRLVGV